MHMRTEMCEVEDLFVKLRQKRLRWFRHVKRAEGCVLGKLGEVTSVGEAMAAWKA